MTDLKKITDRQQAILRLLIQEYVSSAAPVSSNAILRNYNLGVSSATIRNEMSALEDMGFLTQPYTSAGRIPTEKGYRYFVERLMEQIDLPMAEQRMISHQFHQARLELDQWLRLSAAILAHTTKNASLVTAPKSYRCRLKHLELVSIHDNTVLLILVLESGTVKQQIFALDSPMSQDELRVLARQLTDQWTQSDSIEVTNSIATFTGVGAQVGEIISNTMCRIDARRTSDIYHDGLLNILGQPEFKSKQGVQQVVRALEERRLVEQIIEKVLQEGGVHIIIGGDDHWHELSDVGIVLTRYGIGNTLTGAMGVVGPVRMTYGRAVSIVRYMSHLMSNLLSDLYGIKN